MSELLHSLTPTPASIPIITRGNAFYRDGKRFFIKGISYIPRRRQDVDPFDWDAKLDPLTDDRAEELRKNIPLLHELGVNSISVQHLDSSKEHSKALKLLEKAGIYVAVTVCDSIEAPPQARPANNPQDFDTEFDTAPHFRRKMIRDTFTLVSQLADHPNILGFTVSGDVVGLPLVSKMAEVLRACVRDIKRFLKLRRGGRQVPVGISAADRLINRFAHLQYFSAGDPHERADYFAPDCWSWAGKSSFQISGWKNMVEGFERTSPMPMFLNAYGTNVVKPRIWAEVLCLYSPDMTGVFSGGFAYTFFDYARSGGYGVVAVSEGGRRRTKRRDFSSLESKFRAVNVRLPEEVAIAGIKRYEEWRGEFPERQVNRWFATPELPAFPGDWTEVLQQLDSEQESAVFKRVEGVCL
ncbi:hypothetical protein LTR85_007161 [Meristemomyces frigidus]|nr:hypothetical protein LTR85_007161 [Meristemomyces frigidus]